MPKTSPDIMYHFCYISADNQVLGASAPFQFCANPPQIDNTIDSISNVSGSLTSIHSINTNVTIEKYKEIAKLREENGLLKDTLKMIVQNKNSDSIQKELNEMKNMVRLFQKKLTLQELEIEDLKKKLGEMDRLKNMEKFNNFNTIDIGDLETLPPFPNYSQM